MWSTLKYIQAAFADEKGNDGECKLLPFISGHQRFEVSGQNPESTTTEKDDSLNIRPSTDNITVSQED